MRKYLYGIIFVLLMSLTTKVNAGYFLIDGDFESCNKEQYDVCVSLNSNEGRILVFPQGKSMCFEKIEVNVTGLTEGITYQNPSLPNGFTFEKSGNTLTIRRTDTSYDYSNCTEENALVLGDELSFSIPFSISTPDVYRIYNFSNTKVYEKSGGYNSYPGGNNNYEIVTLAKNGNYSEAWEVPDYYSNSDYKQFVVYNSNFDDDTSLSNIKVSNGTIAPFFSSSVTNYTVTTENEKVTIAFYLANNNQTAEIYKYKAGEISLTSDNKVNISGNTFDAEASYDKDGYIIVVKPEIYVKTDGLVGSCSDYSAGSNCKSGMYMIAVTRLDRRSRVNTLKSLKVEGGEISFKPDVRVYTVDVPYEVTRSSFKSTLTDPKSSYVDGYGDRSFDLMVGENTLEIKVKSESGDENVYTITINRGIASNVKLASLTVNNEKLKIKEDTEKYYYNVRNDVTHVEVLAEPSDPDALVAINNIDELQEGTNEVTITVTAQNGNVKIYSLTIKRDYKISDNALLRKLYIDGYNLDFDKNVFEYKLKVDNDVTFLGIDYETDHEKSAVSINGNKDLENGSVVKIKVLAENGSIQVYSIEIEKDVKGKNSNMIIIIVILLILLIGGGVAYFLYNKKKNKRIDSTPLIDKPTPPPTELENMSLDNPFVEEKRTVVIIKASTDDSDKKNE